MGDVGKHSDVQSDGSSTSAGSSISAGSGTRTSHLGRDEWGLVTPASWRIRNTFLDMPVVPLTALQSFQRSRRALSCPAGGREATERDDLAAMEPKPSHESSPARSADEDECPVTRAHTTAVIQHIAPRPLALADLVGPQPHSKGSVLHFQGTCKPCAFFWKVVGCKYGPECEFCHLCDADERKRRNKEKRMAMHALQAGGRSHCLGLPSRPSRSSRLGGA